MRSTSYILILIASFFSLVAYSGTEYPVTWEVVRNAEVSGTTLSKTAGAKGQGLAHSSQVLFARGEANVFSGHFSYINNDGSGSTKMRTIGYSPINDPDVGAGQIVYGFTFAKNNKLKLFSPEGQIEVNYTTGTKIKLERANTTLNYYVDGVVVYSVVVSSMESLEVKAKLLSPNATFTDVKVSYETTQFCVLPTIDNINKRISLQITGGFPPYKYTWEFVGDQTCRTDCPLEAFVEGPNTVIIFDSQGNRIRRTYSLGTDATWTSFYQSAFSNYTLTNTSTGNKWGTATIGTNYASTLTGWVEYVIEKELDGQKAFGFADASETIRKTKHLKAGFLISKDQLQVIDNGAVVHTIDYLDKDVLNIGYTDGEVTWLKNGEEVYTSTYSQNGDVTIAGLVKNAGTLKKVNYSANPPAIINTIWDDIAETGTINVDITSINGVTGPFHYMIAEEPVPHLDDVYSILKDSIGIDIDSIAFYTGQFPLTTHSFDNLEAGTYYVTTFDSQGNRLFSKEVHIQGGFTFETQSNLVASGTKISAPVQDGFGELELYTYEELNSELTVKVGRNGTSFIGYAEIGTTVADYSNLTHGFYLDKRKLYTVENGVLSSTFTILRRNEDFYFKTLNGVLSLSTQNEELSSVTLPLEFTYKVAVGMSKSQTITLLGKALQKKKFKVFAKITQNFTCSGDVGTFSISMNGWGQLQGASGIYTITHQESGDVIALNAPISDQIPIPITTNGQGGPLKPGIYEVVVTVNGLSKTKKVCLGYEAQWDSNSLAYFDLTPNTYSVYRTLMSGGGLISTARSENVLPISQQGWVEFTPKTHPSGFSFMRVTTENILSPTFTLTEDFFAFKRVGNQILMGWYINPGTPVVGATMIPIDARVKIKFLSNQIEIWVNGALEASINAISRTRLVRCQTEYKSHGFENVITSFSCTPQQTLTTIGYTELKKKLDGGYAHAVEGKVKFTFDEEYDIQVGDMISLNVYDNDFNVIEQINSDGTSINGTPGVDYKFDDNKRILDISGIPGLITDEYYILEVTTSTEEKLYMRFIYKY